MVETCGINSLQKTKVMYTHEFRTEFNLPATLCHDGNHKYGTVFLKCAAQKNSNSVSIEVTIIEKDDVLSLKDFLCCIVDNYNDSPEQFMNAMHDHMQTFAEQNWPLPEWDGPEEDQREDEYINSLSVRPFEDELPMYGNPVHAEQFEDLPY